MPENMTDAAKIEAATVTIRDQAGADARLDLAMWEAICAPELHRLPMSLAPMDDWVRWLNRLQTETCGYWHGTTGRIFERLNLPYVEWSRMCRIRQPEAPKSLGDSSMDFFWLLIPEGLDTKAVRYGR